MSLRRLLSDPDGVQMGKAKVKLYMTDYCDSLNVRGRRRPTRAPRHAASAAPPRATKKSTRHSSSIISSSKN